MLSPEKYFQKKFVAPDNCVYFQDSFKHKVLTKSYITMPWQTQLIRGKITVR
jgi:hypothetical protein